jgi:hypothetical protein
VKEIKTGNRCRGTGLGKEAWWEGEVRDAKEPHKKLDKDPE